ncbi:hypothetical protein BCR44DRAFT_44179 [Catenaria anguillulae PL171]|uniref:Uncharacterized protein n=1 Tax=Catenaria anguillulae PL171 TaxID=765915 RepID=A0A1Y2H571_9FUNG|nr:hypothetical protein BCR44DRAFT_44179 [Catenaria anguillulae PL171]
MSHTPSAVSTSAHARVNPETSASSSTAITPNAQFEAWFLASVREDAQASGLNLKAAIPHGPSQWTDSERAAAAPQFAAWFRETVRWQLARQECYVPRLVSRVARPWPMASESEKEALEKGQMQ